MVGVYKQMVQKSVLIVAVFLLIGCAGQSNVVNFDENVYKGSEALVMNFVPEVPPRISYTSTGERFDIALELENVGTYPVRGDIWFSGYDPFIIALPQTPIQFPTTSCNFPDIIPRSRSNPFGGKCISEFNPVLNLETVTDSYDAIIQATAMFWYATNADVNFCIDPIPNRFRTSPQACEMRSVSVGGGQGAPVAVTQVEANAIGRGQILYRITVENLGPGIVISNPTLAPSDLRPTDVGIVGYRIGIPQGSFGGSFVSGDTRGGLNVGGTSGNVYFNRPGFYFSQFFRSSDSSYANTVRLHNGRGVITQVVNYGNIQSAFQTPLQVILSYGYLQTTQIPVQIVNVDAYNAVDGGGRIVIDTGSGRVQHDQRGTSVSFPGGGGVDISRLT